MLFEFLKYSQPTHGYFKCKTNPHSNAFKEVKPNSNHWHFMQRANVFCRSCLNFKGGLNMFDNKGQSALEYLMTYGWALIVIAIVIGVLIFVTSGATGGVTCQSQSTGLVLKEWAVTSSSVGITLQNATAGKIAQTTAITATGAGAFSGLTFGTITSDNNVAKNTTFTVQSSAGTVATGNISDAKVNVVYETEGGLTANATIVCNGTLS